MNLNAEQLNALSEGLLPDLLGIALTHAADGEVHARLAVTRSHLAPNGYLHAGAIISLADTACGCGCLAFPPEGSSGFTTIEMKSNHVGTAREGNIVAVATRRHGGRTTQVWDAEVRREDTGKVIALFRCTQLILYPPAPAPGVPGTE